jgi:hypothetical protein
MPFYRIRLSGQQNLWEFVVLKSNYKQQQCWELNKNVSLILVFVNTPKIIESYSIEIINKVLG